MPYDLFILILNYVSIGFIYFDSKVDELNEQHLHYLLMKHKVYLQDIFSGKVLKMLIFISISKILN